MQIRKQLRKQLKDRLTDKTAVADRINIRPAFFDDPFPYMEISTPEDDSELVSNSIRATGHALKCVIDVLVTTDKDDIYDRLDDIAAEIETEIERDETFGKTVSSSVLERTEMGKNEEGDKTLGFIRMIYACEYMKQKTPKAAEDLPRLKGFKIGGPHG